MSRRLIINWQHEESHRILSVAELLVAGVEPAARYEFGYIEAVREARRLGFQPFAAFPEIDRRYVSEALFPFFRNRVMPTTRPDYLEYVAALGLTPDTANVVDLLGRSEGRRHTDRIETVLAAERDAITGGYVTHFLARGVRHVLGAEETVLQLRQGDTLDAVLEPGNPKNARARQLHHRGQCVGYVPDYLLPDLDALEAGSARPSFTLARLNPPPAPAHHRLMIRLDAKWPAGFAPFSGPPFRAVAMSEAGASLWESDHDRSA